MSALSHEARKAIAALELIIRTEEISVPDAARHLKKSPEWVRQHLPIIVHSRKSHSVRTMDIEAYQLRRTVWPAKEFPGKEATRGLALTGLARSSEAWHGQEWYGGLRRGEARRGKAKIYSPRTTTNKER